MKIGSIALALLLSAVPVAAQRPSVDSAAHAIGATIDQTVRVDHIQGDVTGHEPAAPAADDDIIMPHITDAHHLELPWFNSHWGREVELPRWKPIHIGKFAIDLSPTKHVVMLLIAAGLCCLVLITGAHSHKRESDASGHPKGFANGVEAMVLYIRNEVIIPNVGHHGEGYVPYLLTLFFFVLFANALGLFPYLATPTGNISVTATLAVMSFVMIEIAGMRALGKEYIKTIVFWPSDMPFGTKLILTFVLTPVELLGKFTKPFALAIRLFANMTAGHVIVLAFIGIIFTFGSWIIAPAPLLMAIGIMILEVLVALIQAYIFTLLTATFIGQIRTAHH